MKRLSAWKKYIHLTRPRLFKIHMIWFTRFVKKNLKKKKIIERRPQIGYKLRTVYIHTNTHTWTGVSRVVTKTTGDRRSEDGALYYIIYAETITMASLSTQYKGRIKKIQWITIIIINIVCRFRTETVEKIRKKIGCVLY